MPGKARKIPPLLWLAMGFALLVIVCHIYGRIQGAQ